MSYNKPIEIAENIYWMGANEKDTFFRTNSYPIKGKNESILADPSFISQSGKIKEKAPSIAKSLVKEIFICDLWKI